MAHSQLAAHQAPIFVEVSRAGFRHILELEAETDRAFLVGASRQADVFIDAPGAAAVEFHLERLGSDVWLTPAYRGRRLLVNGEPVRDRLQITSGVLLRLGEYELSVKLLGPDEHIGQSTRSSSAPRPLPNDYSLGLPTDTQKTSVAMTSTVLEAADTAPVVARPVSDAPLPDQRTERMAPLVPPRLGVQATERLVPVVPQRPAPFVGAIGPTETVRMQPIIVPALQARAEPQRPLPTSVAPITTSLSTSSARLSPLTTQETTAFDVAALRSSTPESPSAAPEPLTPPTTAALEFVAEARGPSRVPVAPSSLQLFLNHIGLATQQRPLLVVGAALAGSFVLALALVGASRLSHPGAPAAAHHAPSKAAAAASAMSPSSAAVPSPAPTIVVAPSPPEPEAAAHGAPPSESASRAAMRNLSAGRLAEAAEQYRAAGSLPDGVVYAEVASLLSRRLSATCTAKNSPASGCPEILK